jgi:hypothetical protein
MYPSKMIHIAVVLEHRLPRGDVAALRGRERKVDAQVDAEHARAQRVPEVGGDAFRRKTRTRMAAPRPPAACHDEMSTMFREARCSRRPDEGGHVRPCSRSPCEMGKRVGERRERGALLHESFF